MTSRNRSCGEAGSGSHPPEKQTPTMCVLGPLLLPLDNGLLLLESQSPDVLLRACCRQVFAASLGFFTPSRGCNTPSPRPPRGADPSDCKQISTSLYSSSVPQRTRSPSSGVNTGASSAAPTVNKSSGETITILAFRNKPWSFTKGRQKVPHIFHDVQSSQDTHTSLEYPRCWLN